jgi:hypothetical protein
MIEIGFRVRQIASPPPIMHRAVDGSQIGTSYRIAAHQQLVDRIVL